MSVMPRLVYVSRTPEALAWADDYKARSNAVHERRFAWMKDIYDAAGVPEDDEDTSSWKRNRGGWSRDGYFAGLSWPRSMDDKLPEGWFRPAKEEHLVRPRESTKLGKAIRKEMDALGCVTTGCG